jgi:hypothetical protein
VLLHDQAGRETGDEGRETRDEWQAAAAVTAASVGLVLRMDRI